MPKLVDADKLKEHYAWWDNEDKKIFDTIVDLQPEAVVPCKDCRFYNTHDHRCVRMNHGFKDDFFCSWGERREDAET